MSTEKTINDAASPADSLTGMTLDGPPIDVEKTLEGQALLVIGCTGFLGKVWSHVCFRGSR